LVLADKGFFAAPSVAPGGATAAVLEVATARSAVAIEGAAGIIAPCAGPVTGTASVVSRLPGATAIAVVPAGPASPVVAREAALAEGVPILPASPGGTSEAVPGRSRCSAAGGRLAPAVGHVVSRFLVVGGG